MKIAAVFILAWAPLGAQEIKLPARLEKLAAKAEESVNITLDGTTLRLAARFLSDKDSEEARVKKAISGLESVSVHSYQFARDGEYDPADVNGLRAQLASPAWSRILGVKSTASQEDMDVYFKIDGKGQLAGVVIISAEPRGLIIVTIAGTLDLEQLADLGGQFHIPEMDLAGLGKGRKDVK